MKIRNFDKLANTTIVLDNTYSMYEVTVNAITVHEHSKNAYIHRAHITIHVDADTQFDSHLILSTGNMLYKPSGIHKDIYTCVPYGVLYNIPDQDVKGQIGLLTICTDFKDEHIVNDFHEIQLCITKSDIKNKDIFIEILKVLYGRHADTITLSINRKKG